MLAYLVGDGYGGRMGLVTPHDLLMALLHPAQPTASPVFPCHPEFVRQQLT